MDTPTVPEPPRIDRGPLGKLPPTLEWVGGADGVLRLLDQTALPEAVVFRDCSTAADVWDAIRRLQVRGAPAIGVAAGYGVCLGTRRDWALGGAEFVRHAAEVGEYLCGARPTAVNLAWAVRRVIRAGESARGDGVSRWTAQLAEAHALAREDAEVCRRIGIHGQPLVPDEGGVLTHCNAGALATVAYGTALSMLYMAHAAGKRFKVYVDETRPLLQGARLTAFELVSAGLDVTVLCDGAAASLMRAGRVALVVVGADRIAANGDVANKIGTYPLALAARAHGIPFYVAAPRSTFDASIPCGAAIPIEERSGAEISSGLGRCVTPPGVACWNPAFDVTPAALIHGIVTQDGVLTPVNADAIARYLSG